LFRARLDVNLDSPDGLAGVRLGAVPRDMATVFSRLLGEYYDTA
jgi:hypothetical protein